MWSGWDKAIDNEKDCQGGLTLKDHKLCWVIDNLWADIAKRENPHLFPLSPLLTHSLAPLLPPYCLWILSLPRALNCNSEDIFCSFRYQTYSPPHPTLFSPPHPTLFSSRPHPTFSKFPTFLPPPLLTGSRCEIPSYLDRVSHPPFGALLQDQARLAANLEVRVFHRFRPRRLIPPWEARQRKPEKPVSSLYFANAISKTFEKMRVLHHWLIPVSNRGSC